MLRLIRLVLGLVIALLAAVGLYTVFGGGGRGGPPPPAATSVVALAPVSRGEILSQMKLITVERQYNIPVVGSAWKQMPGTERGGALGGLVRAALGGAERVPGTTEELVYQMVTTVTAGLDLSRIDDHDIVNSADETTLTLPQPEVLAVQTDFEQSRAVYRNGPSVPFMSHSADLIRDLQRAGEKKHREEAARDAEFMDRARLEARRSLLDLLKRAHPHREIHIVFDDRETTAGK